MSKRKHGKVCLGLVSKRKHPKCQVNKHFFSKENVFINWFIQAQFPVIKRTEW